MIVRRVLLAFLLFPAVLASGQEGAENKIDFATQIQPLLSDRCYFCHGPEKNQRKADLRLDKEEAAKDFAITPGDPDDSEFFESLTDSGDDLMPPSPMDPLSGDQIQKLETWILQGAKNNECIEGCDSSDASYARVIWPMMEQNCTGCHNAGYPGGGIVIEGRDDLVALAENGSLMGSVRWEPAYARMPISKKLSDCDIGLLQKWIDEGYAD